MKKFNLLVLGLCLATPLFADTITNGVYVGDLQIQADGTASPAEAGDLIVQGTVDIHGVTMALGEAGGASSPGMTITYTDDASGSNTTIALTARRASTSWKWRENTAGTAKDKMKLDTDNVVTLYNPSNGTAGVTLSPTGTSVFVNGITVGGSAVMTLATSDARYLSSAGSNVLLPSQTLTGTNSVLTQGLADNRYLHPDGSGFVGIGTTTPANKLQVGSGTGLDSGAVSAFYGANTSGGRISVGASDASKQIQLGTDATAGYVTTLSNQPIALRPNNVAAMTLLTNGNVGIGITSPTSLLHVKGSGTAKLTVESTSTDGSASLKLLEPTNNGIDMTYNGAGGIGGGQLEIKNNSTQAVLMTVDRSGVVGIGTTAPPTAKLEVNGAAKVNGAFTTTGVITAAAGGDIPMFTGN